MSTQELLEEINQHSAPLLREALHTLIEKQPAPPLREVLHHLIEERPELFVREALHCLLKQQPELFVREMLDHLIVLKRKQEEDHWADVLPDPAVEQEVLNILDGQESPTR